MPVADKVLTVGFQVARLGEWFRLNQRQWGEELGLDRSTIAAYKNVEGKGPSRERLKSIAATYGVPLNWFYQEEPTDPPVPRDIEEAKRLASVRKMVEGRDDSFLDEGSPIVSVPDVDMPFRGYIPADEGWDEDESDDFPTISVPAFLARKDSGEPERVAMKVKNGSMEPRLYDGDLVVVVEDHTPRPGRMVVARSGKRRTVKVLRRNGMARYTLESINPEHGEAVAKEWEIVGYVIAILRDYASNRGTIEWDEGGLTP